MPGLDLAEELTQKLNQSIAEELCRYQRLVNRADRLTKKIMAAQERVDALKCIENSISQYESQPHCNAQQFSQELLDQVQSEPISMPTAKPIVHTTADPALSEPLFDDEMNAIDELSASQLEKQYHQHRSSCELMHEYCEQSYEFLQLLRFQAEQLRESIVGPLQNIIRDTAQVDAILNQLK